MNPGNFLEFCDELTLDIENSYSSETTIQEAEKLAAKFLFAMMRLSAEIKTADLDARMKKSGLKAVKAAVYMEAAKASDKKPSDSFLQNLVDLHELVQDEQKRFDAAEVYKNELENYYNIFKEAHVYFRGISKGRFE